MIQSAPIFLLDSEPASLASMQALFRCAGYETSTFEDPYCLLETMRGLRPTAIVASASMPSMQGVSLIKALHDIRPRLPIVLIAADSDIATAVQALKSGASNFIEKPVVDRILLELVEQAIASTE